ncbi:SDR family NAD(P)-dependent oxidoreductase [Roseicyclus sp. F158]|uniref:SDR family NAD(P)-dependent oxidoreductase n=1 Tax=Tropicimonas omnivorans TaxID=3075590 RepID=A0ABU3DKC2_9RHOB|nr:SDR family NAD(P)-dependent oxidoreductase [Roseicyclus sp. F158]MDT0684150.1 SDR family NAD(P)-dependent oxidoreductase [Roseicyclus sp. F158]
MASGETALITGASSGIGRELAALAAEDGCRLILTAHEPEVKTVADALRGRGVDVTTVVADLATARGVEELWAAVGSQRIDYLLANAGRGLGDAFLDQSLDRIEEVIHLNVTGTTALVHRAAQSMRDAGGGRILITGSLAGNIPGSYQAVYNATKAYIDTFAYGIRNELKDAGVTVTCLMPGPVETDFFHRADMDDTPVGQSDSKADAEKVAREGWMAVKAGKSGVSPTFMTKLQSAMSGILPDSVLARLHRDMAEPEEKTHG